jgi:hypothetical protein
MSASASFDFSGADELLRVQRRKSTGDRGGRIHATPRSATSRRLSSCTTGSRLSTSGKRRLDALCLENEKPRGPQLAERERNNDQLHCHYNPRDHFCRRMQTTAAKTQMTPMSGNPDMNVQTAALIRHKITAKTPTRILVIDGVSTTLDARDNLSHAA